MQLKKFRTKELYEGLNRKQQKILIAQYRKKFKVSLQQFYNVLNGSDLSADQLLFFSEIFDCDIRQVYAEAPEAQRRLADLEKEKEEQLKEKTQKVIKDIGLM